MGGGARILRSLLAETEAPAISISTAPSELCPQDIIRELHVPRRRPLGRIENTRLYWMQYYVDAACASRFQARLEATLRQEAITAVHALPHALDIIQTWGAAKSLGLPFVLNVQDDLRFTLHKLPWLHRYLRQLGEVWRGADARIVISEEMGIEYGERYGERGFTIVTDGLIDTAFREYRPHLGRDHLIYFMGMLHNGYIPNVIALLEAIHRLVQDGLGDWKLVMRCGRTELDVPTHLKPYLTALPYTDQAQIEREMVEAEMVYLPLAIGKEHDDFNRFSLSTKMVSYLAAGKPIVYHGPPGSAAERLLARHRAAIVLDSLDPEAIKACLLGVGDRGATYVAAAQDLGRAQFMLADQRAKLWQTIRAAAASKGLA